VKQKKKIARAKTRTTARKQLAREKMKDRLNESLNERKKLKKMRNVTGNS